MDAQRRPETRLRTESVGCLTIFTPSRTHGSSGGRPSPAAPPPRVVGRPGNHWNSCLIYQALNNKTLGPKHSKSWQAAWGPLVSWRQGVGSEHRGRRTLTASVQWRSAWSQRHPDIPTSRAESPNCPSDPDETVKLRPESDQPEQNHQVATKPPCELLEAIITARLRPRISAPQNDSQQFRRQKHLRDGFQQPQGYRVQPDTLRHQGRRTKGSKWLVINQSYGPWP